jgi:hypothetical protein
MDKLRLTGQLKLAPEEADDDVSLDMSCMLNLSSYAHTLTTTNCQQADIKMTKMSFCRYQAAR